MVGGGTEGEWEGQIETEREKGGGGERGGRGQTTKKANQL